MQPSKAIVFSCDENFSPLAKGLVLSLKRQGFPNSDVDVVFLNFGCRDETLAWLEQRRIKIHPLHDDQLPSGLLFRIQPHQRAQVCRPNLHTILPSYDMYLWLDSDTWVQGSRAVDDLIKAAESAESFMLIAPELHPSYPYQYRSTMARLADKHAAWFEKFTDRDTARDYGARAVLNSGVFCLARSSIVWDLWKDKLESASGDIQHISEQVALNVVLYESQHFVALDPLYNYNCLYAGTLKRHKDSGTWICGDSVPERPIEIMHLVSFTSQGERYQKQGLLFDQGSYLDHKDYEKLNSLCSKN